MRKLGLAWLGLAWLGLAWLGLAWLGLAWLGCSGRADSERGSALSGLSLLDRGGNVVSASNVLRPGARVFFTCGCKPCHAVATVLADRSRDYALISSQDVSETLGFAAASGFRGKLYVDPGSRVMLATQTLDCPRVCRIDDSGRLQEVPLEPGAL